MKLEPQDLSRRTEDFRAPAPEGEAPASAASLRSGAPHTRLPTPHPQASSSQRGEGSTEHQAGPRPRRRAAGSPGPGEPGTRQQRGPRGVRPSGFAGGVLNTLSAVLSHAEGELGGVLKKKKVAGGTAGTSGWGWGTRPGSSKNSASVRAGSNAACGRHPHTRWGPRPRLQDAGTVAVLPAGARLSGLAHRATWGAPRSQEEWRRCVPHTCGRTDGSLRLTVSAGTLRVCCVHTHVSAHACSHARPSQAEEEAPSGARWPAGGGEGLQWVPALLHGLKFHKQELCARG